MGSSPKLLSELRAKTIVDCDTLDASVAESLGPFQDCTSNQAIAYFELLNTRHEDLIRQSADAAKKVSSKHPGIKLEALAVEICMIKLGLLILPHLKGRMHIQVNPFDAYSTSRTVSAAQRIVDIFNHLSPNLNAKDRVCIKIPSTWEGLQACRTLERDHGISTLATTLFALEQAAVAAEAGCRYIAPYVNELAVHFEEGLVDPSPNHLVCVQSQLYFQKHGYARTATLPASLTTIAECMSLSGVKHITIAPPLLRALNETTSADVLAIDGNFSSLFENEECLRKVEATLPEQPLDLIDDEERFRMLFTRRDNGKQEIKQVKAINIFADMQVKLEEIVRPCLQ
ncbi:hypothetical protein LTR05_006830 [Lithohypha guttulata]|uniref:Transaldolase n=1 Tax=Lithohypha guttulata TaxID=1690604 RepID=A0AAN7SVX7_9EURO|nr:hypothetical protein LTR05_006830 [Lithohypha guttulata]